MKALVLDVENRAAILQDIQSPTPASNEVLVRVQALSFNPVDPLYVVHLLAGSGRIIGTDFAGTVIATGPQIATIDVKPGDRVLAFCRALSASMTGQAPSQNFWSSLEICYGRVQTTRPSRKPQTSVWWF